MLIDTHTHVNFNAYKDDSHEVIQRSIDQDIWMVNVGSQKDTSKRALHIANQYSQGVYAAIGLHPIHLFPTHIDEKEITFSSRQERFDSNFYQALLDSDTQYKIKAIGEIGLDYYHIPKNVSFERLKEVQSQEFIKQLNFARQNKLPVILHCRGSSKNPMDAYYDILDIISNLEFQPQGVIHCFSGSLEIAQKFIEQGFYVGFTGILTFGKNADDLREVAKHLPLNKILIETDAPYLAPDPYRGKRNEPSYVEFVAKKLADIKKVDHQQITDITTQNAKALFRL